MDYPDGLRHTTWERKAELKGKVTDLLEELESLAGLHAKVDWTSLTKEGLLSVARSPDQLETAAKKAAASWTTSATGLGKAAQRVTSEIKKARVALAKNGPALESLKKIETALGGYGAAIDKVDAALAQAVVEAGKVVAAKDADEDDDADARKLLAPERLRSQLQACQRDPLRRIHFAFVDAVPLKKKPPAMVVHPSTSGTSLFAKLKEATGVKTGSYGTAWVDGQSLRLKVEKPASGLAKKMRLPIKLCGFRITDIVIIGDDDKPFEQDRDDEADKKPTGTTAPRTGTTAPKLDPVEQAFVRALYDGKADALAPLKKAFDPASLDRMYKAFGGESGLRAVRSILDDVCGGDPKRLRSLVDALA